MQSMYVPFIQLLDFILFYFLFSSWLDQSIGKFIETSSKKIQSLKKYEAQNKGLQNSMHADMQKIL
jgi:F0F1-type ATP synthase membrane subunit b/b'